MSYAIDGVEARHNVDLHGTRAPAIEVSKDGPYRVTGGVPLVDGDGSAIARNHGASHEHYALCRCGQSQNKPFCSGMHYDVNFRDPVPAPDHQPTLFEWAGGLPALTRMTRRFYETHVPPTRCSPPCSPPCPPTTPNEWRNGWPRCSAGRSEYSEDTVATHRCSPNTSARTSPRSNEPLGHPPHAVGPRGRAAQRRRVRLRIRVLLRVGNPPGRRELPNQRQPPQQMPMPHWEWNTAAGPPGSRISALAPDEHDENAGEVVMPEPGQPLSFEQHIKPLFRRRDRQSMQFAFDLWSHHDVSTHADAILTRLQAGSMPCDGAWPDDRTDLFRRWIDAGKLD